MKLLLVLAITLGSTATVLADASPEAETLFRDGKRLMKEGKLAEACAAFAGSERREHNLSTVLSLADCRDKNGQFASAWALFLQAESQTRSDPAKASLNTTAKTRAAALEQRLSYLTINVPDESRVPDLVVYRDGQLVDLAEWNRAIPADGGVHEIAGKAPGHESWSTRVTLGAEHDKQAVEVPKFKSLPALAVKPAPRAIMSAPPAPSPWTRRREVAVGVAASGLAVAGVAIYFGLDARNSRDEAIATCPPASCSVAAAAGAQDLNDKARRHALYANVGFGIAGAAIAAGAVLFYLGGPAEVAVAPTMTDAGAGAAIVGRF